MMNRFLLSVAAALPFLIASTSAFAEPRGQSANQCLVVDEMRRSEIVFRNACGFPIKAVVHFYGTKWNSVNTYISPNNVVFAYGTGRYKTFVCHAGYDPHVPGTYRTPVYDDPEFSCDASTSAW